jgi:hypothetical protein
VKSPTHLLSGATALKSLLTRSGARRAEIIAVDAKYMTGNQISMYLASLPVYPGAGGRGRKRLKSLASYCKTGGSQYDHG